MPDKTDPTKLSLSPTKVDTFFGCRRLFYYRFIEPPFTPPENRYFLIGNIAHKALELYHKTSARSQSRSKELAGCFRRALETYKAKVKIKQGVISKNDIGDIANMLKNYLRYVHDNGDPKVAAVEKLVKITINGVVIWLKADRIDKLDDNLYKVVDYKTGHPATHTQETDSVQIPSYGLMVRQEINKKAKIVGEYLYLKHMTGGKGIHAHDITEKMMEKTVEKYTKVNKLLKNGCDFPKNLKYRYCRSCDFSNYCRSDK
jgi:CRISPR/Cas system-associated exonuclease Cas4 (RecB family)